MADWSWGNFAGKAKGLLQPENQMALLENPMFNAGMGLLSSSYDPNINPFQAVVGGAASARKTQQENEDRKRLEELRKQLAELMKNMPNASQTTPPWMQQPAITPGVSPAPAGPNAMGGGGSYVQQQMQNAMRDYWMSALGNTGNS